MKRIILFAICSVFVLSTQAQTIKGKLIDVSNPLIMGILNITPDSFYDGANYMALENSIKQVDKMITEGVDIIDIGGMSSRPGAEEISIEEEVNRVVPVITAILAKYPNCIISIDTYRSIVAEKAINAGASIVNDISAGNLDPSMFQTIANLNVPYIMMHMQGIPKNMQDKPSYDHIVTEVIDFFIPKIVQLQNLGVKDILIDPGFGFGKTMDHNYQMVRELEHFKILNCPILVGISRKSMIYNLLKIDASQALNGTTALHMALLMNGAQILRVHDVAPAKEAITIFKQLNYLTT